MMLLEIHFHRKPGRQHCLSQYKKLKLEWQNFKVIRNPSRESSLQYPDKRLLSLAKTFMVMRTLVRFTVQLVFMQVVGRCSCPKDGLTCVTWASHATPLGFRGLASGIHYHYAQEIRAKGERSHLEIQLPSKGPSSHYGKSLSFNAVPLHSRTDTCVHNSPWWHTRHFDWVSELTYSRASFNSWSMLSHFLSHGFNFPWLNITHLSILTKSRFSGAFCLGDCLSVMNTTLAAGLLQPWPCHPSSLLPTF